MNEILLDPFRHNAWATEKLLQFCRTLTPEQLQGTAVGAFGTIQATLKHILDGEANYHLALVGSYPEWDWSPDEVPSLKVLEQRAGDMKAFWERIVASPFDPDMLLARQNRDGSRDESRAGVVLAQVLNHGNEHRGQVCTILTTLGIQPPQIDGWGYGVATGRVRMGVRD